MKWYQNGPSIWYGDEPEPTEPTLKSITKLREVARPAAEVLKCIKKALQPAKSHLQGMPAP